MCRPPYREVGNDKTGESTYPIGDRTVLDDAWDPLGLFGKTGRIVIRRCDLDGKGEKRRGSSGDHQAREHGYNTSDTRGSAIDA